MPMQREAAVLHSLWHLRTALSGVCVLAGGMAGEPLAFVHGGVHARLPAAVRRVALCAWHSATCAFHASRAVLHSVWRPFTEPLLSQQLQHAQCLGCSVQLLKCAVSWDSRVLLFSHAHVHMRA